MLLVNLGLLLAQWFQLSVNLYLQGLELDGFIWSFFFP